MAGKQETLVRSQVVVSCNFFQIFRRIIPTFLFAPKRVNSWLLASYRLYISGLRKANAESSHKVRTIRAVKTGHCGIVVTTLARKARAPGSIPDGDRFYVSPDFSEHNNILSVCNNASKWLLRL